MRKVLQGLAAAAMLAASALLGVGQNVERGPNSSATPSIPDIATLLSDVEKNQKAVEKIVENYTYRMTDGEYEADGKGQSKLKSVREFDVFYLGGQIVFKMTSKDGRALSAADQNKENERLEKLVREFQRRQAKEAAGHRKVSKPEQGKLAISILLLVSRFTNPRRERYRGQEVIAFNFEGMSDYKPKNLNESLAQKLVGVMWVDDAARQVVRVEAHLADSVKLGGGLLASIQKGSAFVFEQALVNNEVWLPSYSEVHASARILLVKAFRQNSVHRYSDYKKFRVESVIKPTTDDRKVD